MSCRLDGEPSSTVSTPLTVETGLCKGKRGVVFVAMYMRECSFSPTREHTWVSVGRLFRFLLFPERV